MDWKKILTASLYLTLMAPSAVMNADLLTEKPESLSKPVGIDLDVTYIRRTPLYNPYQVVWRYGSQMPVLAPGTEDDKRWPDYGETVTFTAHFKNKGTVASGSFQYRWHIDGAEVESGTYTSLDPGEEGMTTHEWPWAHTVVNEQLQGQHTIAFTVDSDDLILETYETNNTLTDRTDALSLCLQLQPETYEAHEMPVDPVWPFSAEDWFQKQISALNGALARSVHPLSPDGVTERARIDQILIRDDFDEVACQGADGSWFSEGSHTPWSRGDPYYDLATDVDWAGPHEFGHRLLGLIDTYALGYSSTFGGSNVLDQSGHPVLLSRNYPEPGLMSNNVQFFAEEHSAALNLNKGYRRGYFGEYLFDTPDQTSVLVLDSEGNPAPAVDVTFFQQSPDPPPRFDNNPEISVTTDDSGIAVLPNRPVSGSGTTRTGHTYRGNPFGDIESFGGPGNIFLVRIKKGTHEEYIWWDITNLNRLAWAGQDVLQIRSHVPPLGAPSPPGDFRIVRQQNAQVELRWDPSPTPGITGYNVYKTVGINHDWTVIASGVTELSLTIQTESFHLEGGLAVTAIDGSGHESGFSNLVWTLHMWSPSAVAVDENNNRLIAASGSQLALQDQNGQFLKWLGRYAEWVAYWSHVWLNPEERSHITHDSAGNTVYSVPSQHEVVIGVPESQGPFQRFGSYGSAPGQLDTPTGIAFWGKPCEFGGPYSVDEHTLLLAHFDGDLGGEQGEVAISSGTSFEQGIHDRGVLINNGDTLAYSREGNLESWQGAIEFWFQPNWNGSDQGHYELFQVKDDLDDYSNHAMWLAKNYWGNLDSWGDMSVNIDDLSAGEWYHIAFTWKGSALSLYIDGELRHSGNGVPRDIVSDLLNVGSSCCSGGHQANAVFDELRISDIPRIGNSDTCEQILVADSGNDRIQAFSSTVSSTGAFVSAYGSSGLGPGQFDNPQGLVVDDLGNLIVVDSGNNRLQVLDYDGRNFKFVKEILGNFNAPRDVAAPNYDQIVVADTGNSAIKVLDDESNLLATYLEPNDGLYLGYFSQPLGVAVDLNGNIVVADTLNDRVTGISSPYVSPPPSDFVINSGLNGAWFNPATSGQGQLIDVEPASQFMFLAWFAYTEDSSGNPNQQHWLTAQGSYSGNRAVLPVYETLGGKFDDPQAVSSTVIGSLELTFNDCAKGQASYTIDSWGVTGSFPLSRVIPGSENVCSSLAVTDHSGLVENDGWDGAWYDPATAGQGFLIDIHPNPDAEDFIFIAWFTYGDTNASGQRWLTAQGSLNGTQADIAVYETTGGSFDDPATVSSEQIGTMNIKFNNCNSASLTYELTNEALSGSIDIVRVIPGTEALCEELAGMN